MLKDSQIWVILEERHYDRSQYLINVDVSGNVNSENMKGSTVVMRESTPHMYASSSISVMLDYTRIGISFSRTTPDAISPISKGDIKPAFIGEHC
jgi:hypothetical protein